MATEKQIAANRRNAQKSTGPKSPEGKAKVAKNRTTHGLAGEFAVLPGENLANYDSIRATLTREWEPESEVEAFQIELMAQSQWRLIRAARVECEVFRSHADFARKMRAKDTPEPPLSCIPREVQNLSRYESRLQRSYYLALNTLRQLQADRLNAGPAANSGKEEDAPAAEAPNGNPVNTLPPHQTPQNGFDHSNPICPPKPPPPSASPTTPATPEPPLA